MADDFFADDEIASAPGAVTASPAALDAAMNGAAASTEEARAFLREQEKLTRLQVKILHEEHALELSHLGWRRFNDRIKGALEIMVMIVGIVIIAGIVAVLWNASRADGLVIDSFSVPPSYTQAGIGGETVAADITDKLSAIRRFILAYSFTETKSISAEGRDDVRVEIPETGVSLSEAWRYLRSWLGHERHMNGSLRDAGDGNVKIVVDIPGSSPISETAEDVFTAIDPRNMAVYLFDNGRSKESDRPAALNVRAANTPQKLAGAYALWSLTTAVATGDFSLALARARLAAEIDPNLVIVHQQLGLLYRDLGRDEAALHELEAVKNTLAYYQGADVDERTFRYIQSNSTERIAELQGNFAAAVGEECFLDCPIAVVYDSRAENLARLHDVRASRHSLTDAAAAENGSVIPGHGIGPADATARYFFDAEIGDWRAAKADAAVAARAIVREASDTASNFSAAVVATGYVWRTAIAAAHLGQFAEAHRTIDRTPRDCYACAREGSSTNGKAITRARPSGTPAPSPRGRRFRSPGSIGERCCCTRAIMTRRSRSSKSRTRKARISPMRCRCGARR
jgi:tetratricopeptide (TPR) repeat protein